MVWFTVFFVVLFIIFINTAIVIHSRNIGVLERLGKFHKILDPGLHILIPFLDSVAYRHEMREQVLDVPAQSCITRDNIQVEVDGIIYIKVMDAHAASYGIENYHRASVNLAQTTMRSELGKLTLHNSFSERDSLNQIVVAEIDKASKHWGIKVLRYEIMNIIPSDGVVHTLEKAMEAERDRRAEVTLATAEKEAMSTISEGKREAAINVSEGEKQKRINEAEGKAQQLEIIADATAYGITKVANAISAPSGDKAVKLKIMEQFISEFGNIIDSANVSVVPSGLANIKGIFEGFDKVASSLAKKDV